MKQKIYVAGPYSKGDKETNVRNAFTAANQLADLGFAPFVPHAYHYWNKLYPRPNDFWVDLHNQFLPGCDAILRIPGYSIGSDDEEKLAESLNIPVFYDIGALVEYFESKSFVHK